MSTSLKAGHLIRRMDHKFYPDCEDHWDSKIFSQKVRRFIRPRISVLDLGAGRGALEHLDMRGPNIRVFGTDVDPAVEKNRQLDEGRTISANGRIPWEDESFDLIFSSFVWEHVEKPVRFLKEARRVLRAGGIYLAQTPSSRHYVAAGARLTPYGFHKAFNSLRGRATFDTFPTFYRLNSRSSIQRTAEMAGLALIDLDFIEKRPEYLRVSPVTYVAGIAYERLVNLTPKLESFRASIIATLGKEPTDHSRDLP